MTRALWILVLLGGCDPIDLPIDPIDPEPLHAMLDEPSLLLVNVHVPFEGEIEGTDAHVAWSDVGALEAFVEAFGEDHEDPDVVLYCLTSFQSLVAGEALVDRGHAGVRFLDGGMEGWEEAGFVIVD